MFHFISYNRYCKLNYATGKVVNQFIYFRGNWVIMQMTLKVSLCHFCIVQPKDSWTSSVYHLHYDSNWICQLKGEAIGASRHVDWLAKCLSDCIGRRHLWHTQFPNINAAFYSAAGCTYESVGRKRGYGALVALKCESPRSSAPALTATTIAMETWRHIIRCATNYIHMHAHSHTHTDRHIGMHRCVCVCVHRRMACKEITWAIKIWRKVFLFFPAPFPSLSPPPALCAAAATSRVVAKLSPSPPAPLPHCTLPAEV